MRAYARLVRSDVARVYGARLSPALLWRAVANPSIRAAALVRLAASHSPLLHLIARNMLTTLCGIDVGKGVEIGPGIYFPHPLCIVLGEGARIGAGGTIYHCVTLGRLKGAYPVIGDGVTIYPHSIIVGGVTVPCHANVKPGSVIRSDGEDA